MVFGEGANGYPDPFGQLVASHRAYDDAEFLQIREHLLAIAYAHEDEVGRGRNEGQLQLAERIFVKFQTIRVVPARAACERQIFRVQRRQGKWSHGR